MAAVKGGRVERLNLTLSLSSLTFSFVRVAGLRFLLVEKD
jgi:hypothetical protein